jgi:uroporphyrinogen-III synthase
MLRPDELAARLEARGHETVSWPLIAVEPVGDEPIDVSGYDWVVVTSITGAHELRRRMRGTPRQVAAIGPGTADAWGRADLVPRVSTQEGLLADLPRPAGRVLFAGAEGARRLLVDAVGADFVPLYRTRELAPGTAPAGDAVVLASPSAARVYGASGATMPAVSIGPETTAAARGVGVRVIAEAATHDLDGLTSAACSSRS